MRSLDTIETLETFVVLARLGSVGKTAEQLHISKASVSRRISALEKSDFFKNTVVVFDEFSSFIPAEINIIKKIADDAEGARGKRIASAGLRIS